MDVKFLIRCRVNLYLTNKLHFSVCVYCNRSHITSQRAKNKKVRHETKSSGVDCCSLHAVTSYLIYYSTHTRKNVIYLFYTIKIQMVYWRILGHEKRTTNPLTWSDVVLKPSVCVCVCVCVCAFIDHGEQPMKMHREVTLLYKRG